MVLTGSSVAAEWTPQDNPGPTALYEAANRTLAFGCDEHGDFAASLTIPAREFPDALRGQGTVQLVFAKDESADGQIVTKATPWTLDGGRIQLTVNDPADAKAAADLALGAARTLDVGMARIDPDAPITAAATVSVVGLGAAISPVAMKCGATAAATPVGPSSWTTGTAGSTSSPPPDDSVDASTSDDEGDDDAEATPPAPSSDAGPIEPRQDIWTEFTDTTVGGPPSAGIENKNGNRLNFFCDKGSFGLEYIIPAVAVTRALAKANQVSIVFQFDAVNGTGPVSSAVVPLNHFEGFSAVVVGQPAADQWANDISRANRIISVGLSLNGTAGNFTEYASADFPAKGSTKAISDLRAACQ